MQKFVVTEPDFGISEFDQNLGQMWCDHCVNPFLSVYINENDEVILIGKFGEFRGKATLDLLASLGEEC